MRIGIDLGGTKIEGIALAADGGVPVRRRVITPRGDYAGTVAAVAGLVAEIERGTGRRAPVGVGIPGALSPATGLVKNANSTWLIGRPLGEDLERALDRPVRLANDADCFALSEAVDGAGEGASPVFGAILGTGVGGGIVVHGRLLRGADAIAGEWGHNPLPCPGDAERPGPACYCGRHGCLETFLSGPALAADYAASGGAPGLDAQRIAARADGGDAAARAALDRWLDRLARGLAGVINILDPEVIVLGGGLSNIRSVYAELPRRLEPHVFSDRVAVRVRPPAHGDSSGVRGAAWLWSVQEAA
jgi:fructokinase